MAHVQAKEGNTDAAPYGLGTHASRSTATLGAVAAMAAGKVRHKARKIAANPMDVSEGDLEPEPGKFTVNGYPEALKTILEVVFAVATNHLYGMEAGLVSTYQYDWPNLTCRFVVVDDCGSIIDPTIVGG